MKQNKQVDTRPLETITAAVVLMRGKHEMRRYTREVHGEDFIDLAREFASKHKEYTVALLDDM